MLNLPSQRFFRRRQKQSGFSIVELMVATAIGLLLTIWAISIVVTSLGNNRKIMAETKVNQGLRFAADLIARDLRNAAYWANSIEGATTTNTGATTASNPYKAVSSDIPNSLVNYSFTRDATENDTLDMNEQFGFRLANGVIEMQKAASTWVPLTDPTTLTMTRMSITPTEVTLDLGDACPTVCSAGTPNCPTTKVRLYEIVLEGKSKKDDQVTRTLTTNVRIRNDELSGFCPA